MHRRYDPRLDDQASSISQNSQSDGIATMIVGMHRSGTSFLTGTLQQYGLELGQHSTWNPHNTRGNRENVEIVTFHESVLAARGSAWNHPPAGPVLWTDAENARALEIISGYAGLRKWGFKDPRSLLMVDNWSALLPRLNFVGIFRHPFAVARSLKKRGFTSIDDAVALWQNYNLRLLELYRRQPFPIFSFDEQPEVLLSKIESFAYGSGLTNTVEEPFFTSELRQQQPGDETLPADIEATLQSLRDIAR